MSLLAEDAKGGRCSYDAASLWGSSAQRHSSTEHGPGGTKTAARDEALSGSAAV